MNCPSCEGKNRDDARFCKHCGADLFLRCRMCGAVLDDDARFCDACGTPVGDIPAAPPLPAPVAAARKVVTVLFGDLTGSTALEERMDAESVRSILDRFYSAMRTEIERHGGRVVKFTGDGVMAAFGVPEVTEDDAARAIDAAIAMRDELEQLASDLQLELSLKIGINTGEVVVSETDDDVVGDAVNIASRLEGAATAGEILVGEDTWRLTRGTSRYEPVEPLTLKGKSEPVPAYRLLSVDERTADSAAAPFVGRETELGRLMAAFQDAVDSNAARLVTIIGSPGLGKTRLARELMNELADVARVRETRCDPAGSSTLAPIAEALRAGTGFTETDSEEEVLTALADRFPDDDPDRERVAKLIGPLFGIGVPGSTEETFWALRRVIEAAAHEQPVVFVLDDIHWAEPLLLDLIEHLHQWIRDAPVLLVGTARPELRDLRPSLTEGGQATDVIALEGLDREATAKLALNLLGTEELPSELLAKIPASTEGNPLFVRELVRMLVDDGVLLRTADGWSVTVDVDAIEVPPTITSLLSARVERLRNDERAVVELASVIGKEFYRGALYDLAPAAVKDQVDGCLESLRRKELVEPVGTYWIDEPVYRFHHVLIRDAAYRRLLKESRADVHERVAEWLARKTEDVLGEHEELLGYHLEQAHEYKQQLGRPDDELGRRAAELLQTAAQRALDRDDLPAAAALSGRALDRLPDGDPCRPELLLIRCEALLSMGDVTHGAPVVAEFERLATTPRLQAWATCFTGHLATLTAPERLQETESSVAAAASELTELGDQAGAAKAHTVHASALAGLGRFGDCEAVLDHALTAARAANDRRRITATLGSAPHAALWGPNPVSRAGGRCLDIVRLLRITTGSPAVEAASLRCQAVLEAFRGRADAARRMLRSARRTLEELGLQHELLETEQFAGIVELVAGDAAAAGAHLRTAHDGFRAVGVDVLAAQSAALLARAHLMLAEDTEAEAFIGTSEHAGTQDLKTAIAWRSVKAEILARRGEFDEARRLAQEAVVLAERTDALIDHGNACRSLGAVLRAAGDAAGAKGAEDRALALFERKGATALITTGATEAQALQQHPPVSTPSLLNRCATVIDRAVDLIRRNDWNAVRSVLSEDATNEDNRPGFRTSTLGRDALMEEIRVIADLGFTLAGGELAAVRGEHLCLFRATWREPSGFAVELLYVAEINSDGAVVALCAFDTNDFEAAIAKLDERYIQGEGAVDPDTVRLIGASARSYGVDVDLLRSHFIEDFVVVDHRPASGASNDLDGMLRWIEAAWELTTERTAYVASFEGLAPGVALVRFEVHWTTREGAEYETVLLIVFTRRGDRIAHVEQFLLEQIDLARARFAELASADDRGQALGPLETAATRWYVSLAECFNRADWQAAGELFDPDFVRDDNRSGLRSKGDLSDFFASAKEVAELGIARLSATPIAVRGERLALLRTLWSGDGNDIHVLVVIELGEDGRAISAANFDPDDLYDALRDLEDRYVREEGASIEETVRLAHRFTMTAGSRNDWPALREIISDDFVLVDHRPGYWPEPRGVDDFRAYVDSAFDDSWSRWSWVSRYLHLSPRISLGELRVAWTTADGQELDTSRLGLFVIHDGLIVRGEYFPLDAATEALARVDELERAEARPLGNRSMAVVQRMIGHVMAADWDAYLPFYTDDCVMEDRRRGLRASFSGLDGIREFGKGQQEAFNIRDYECVATRGERLALARGIWRTEDPEGGFDAEVLRLTEIDDDDHVVATIFFDPDDLDAAIAELDQRYIADDAGDGADVWRLAVSFTEAMNVLDEEKIRKLLSDDFTLVDHRPASWGSVHGVEEFLQTQRTWHELWPVQHIVQRRDLAISADALVGELSIVGRSDLGGEVDTSRIVLINVRDGVLHRMEFFPLDQVDEALAAFDALRHHVSVELENAATHFVRRLQDTMNRGTLQEFVDLHAPSFTLDDRRAGLRHVTRGLDQIRAYWIAAMEKGLDRVARNETVAVRGDLLALSRRIYTSARDGAAFESEQLVIDEVDADGRVVAAVFFDPDDLDAAFDELDRRYLAGEAAPFANVLRFGFQHVHATNDPDPTPTRALLADDVVLIDHRPASYGEFTGADELIRIHTSRADLIPTWRTSVPRIIAVAEDRCLAELRIEGVTSEGSAVDTSRLGLLQVRDGLARRVEYFPLEQMDRALARFEELGPRPDVPTLDNACIRRVQEVWLRYERGDWDGLLELYTPDHVTEDLRAGLRGTYTGPGAEVENLKASRSVGARLAAMTPVAVRGERLALVRMEVTGPPDGSAFDTAALVLSEIAGDGRKCYDAVYDAVDLDAAFAELDRRYLAGEGAPFTETLQHVLGVAVDWNRRDWDALMSHFPEDAVFIDRRPASLPEMNGRDALLRWSQALVTPDTRHYILAVHAISERCGVFEMVSRGTNSEGGEVESAYLHVTAFRDGLIMRTDRFALEDRDSALARYAELLEGKPQPDVTHLENESVRFNHRVCDVFARREWDFFHTYFPDDHEFEDRRPGMKMTFRGRHLAVENLRQAAANGAERLAYEPIAVRGEHLALGTWRWDASEWDMEVLVVDEHNAQGQAVRAVVFDPTDVDAGFDELEERYLAGEGAPFAAIYRLLLDQRRAYNARDWDAYRSRCHPEMTFVDHRPAGAGTFVGPDTQITYLTALIDLAPDAQLWTTDVVAIDARRVLARHAVRGSSSEGADIELTFLVLYVMADGRLSRQEVFPLDQRDAAIARFHELGPWPDVDTPRLENEATRLRDEWLRIWNAGLWDPDTDRISPDMLNDDRRTGLSNVFVGRDEHIAQLEIIRGMGAALRGDVIAIRGRRLALHENEWYDPAGRFASTVAGLQLLEYDDAGRLAAAIQFDRDDLNAALIELDERFITGEGAAGAEFVRLQQDVMKAVNAGDWDAYRARLADDVTVIDHRPASMGEIHDADEFVRSNRALYDVMAGFRVRFADVLRASGSIGLSRLVVEGRNDEGGEVDLDVLVLVQLDDGLVTHFEYFPPQQVDDALARYEEIAITRHQLENACTRHWARFADAWNSGRWDGSGHEVSSDVVIDDRRSGLSSVIRGRDGYLAQMLVLQEMDPAARIEVVAIRGERMALLLLEWYDAKGRTGAMVRSLHVHELDDDGRLVRLVVFEPEDLETALAELDGRFLASEEATVTDRLQAALIRAHNERDWPWFEANLSDEFVLADHRPVSLGEVNSAQRFAAFLQAAIELAPDRRFSVLRTQDDRCASMLRASGTDIHGGGVAWDFWMVWERRDRKLTAIHVFGPDAKHEADALVRQLAAATSEGLQNDAVSTLHRFAEIFERQDWGGLERLLAPELIRVDHRRGIGGTSGRDEFIEGSKVLVGLGYGSVRFEAIATGGNRLCLGRGMATGSHDYESDALVLVETTENAQISYLAWFDPGDLDPALDELDERLIAGEGAPHADVIRVHRALRRAVNERRFDDFRDLLAEDLVVIDHRPASLGVTTRERLTEAVRAIIELIPDVRLGFVSYSALDVDKWWLSGTLEGTSTEGAQVDLNSQSVGRVENGRITRFEIFPDDATEEASAAFEALSTDRDDEPTRDILENAVTRAVRRLMDVGDPSDLLSSDEMFVADVRVEDRRPLFQTSGTGVAAVVGPFAAYVSLGMRPVDTDVVAVRGERLALFLGRLADEEGNIIETLGLYEAVPVGRLSHIVFFESDDLAGAFDELEQRYRSGEGAPYADMLERSAAQREALTLGDWDTYRAFFAEDVVLIDHRPASLGEVRGRDEVVRGVQVLAPLIQGVSPHVRAVYAIDHDRMLLQASTRGVSEHGAEVEMSHIRLQQWRDGRVVRIELFPVEGFDAARTRFDELSRDRVSAASAVRENRCSRVLDRLIRAVVDDDLNTMGGLLADDVVLLDRRKGLRNEIHGRAGAIEHIHTGVMNSAFHTEHEAVATRGEQLALFQQLVRYENGFEIEWLVTLEIGEDDRVVGEVFMDPEDIDAAFDELDDRYLARTDVPAGHRASHSFVDAFNAQNWSWFADNLSEDFLMIDTRPVGFGVMDRDSYLGLARSAVEMAPDRRMVIVAERGATEPLLVRATGTDEHGNAAEWTFFAAHIPRGDEIFRYILWPTTAYEAAVSEIAELTAQI